MAVLDLNLDNVKEIHILAEGEHKVRLLDVTLDDNKAKTGQNLRVRMESVKDELADDIYVYLPLPNSTDTVKGVEKKRANIKAFYQCFGIKPNGTKVDLESLKGFEGFVNVSIEQNQQGKDANTIKQGGFLPKK